MPKNIMTVILIFISSIVLTSCSKEEIATIKTYYGNVKGELKGLPGTPDMDVYINNKKAALLAAGGGFGALQVIAGTPVKLELKKKDTDSLLIDTSFTVGRDATAGFILTYSEELGIKGFLQSKAVAPDSISVQFFNKLSSQYSPVAGVDLYICKADFSTAAVLDTAAVIRDFKKDRLMSTITLPVGDPNNATFFYAGMLKDRQTGTFILNEAIGLPFFYVTGDWFYYQGKYCIGIIYDDAGSITANLIDL